MAALIMESADIGAAYMESLAGRMANGTLAVPYALLCAIDVATTLRDLHQIGHAHGNVSTDSIRVSDSGAVLPPRGTRTRSKDCRSDVTAFGAVLYEMLTRDKPPRDLPASGFTPIIPARDLGDLRNDAIRVAVKCLEGWPQMKQVVIELRILRLVAQRLKKVPHRLRVVPMRPEASVTSDHEGYTNQAGPVSTPSSQEMEHQAAADASPGTGMESPRLGASHATIVCPRCSGQARFVFPRSFLDRILDSFSHLRECELCGYRFIVIRFERRRKG